MPLTDVVHMGGITPGPECGTFPRVNRAELLHAASIGLSAFVGVGVFVLFSDTDDDGIADAPDNCARVCNPVQTDVTGERCGDGCIST